jgi:hypothetical protein
VNKHLVFIVVIEISEALLLYLSVCVGVSRCHGCSLSTYCLWLREEGEEEVGKREEEEELEEEEGMSGEEWDVLQ